MHLHNRIVFFENYKKLKFLSNNFVYLWFPVVTFFGFITLCLFEITGSSTGVHFLSFGSGIDSQLLWGTPRPIRSDEWLVQQSWVVSQAQSGYPEINEMFPGGTNMTLLNELPSWDWSSLFRPHLWGYLFGGIDFGAAWFWWLPAFVLITSVYGLGLLFLPRKTFAVSLISLAIFFTPMIQWWYTPTTAASVSWPFICMVSITLAFKSDKPLVRFLSASVAGYFAISLAMGLYFPFIFPGIIVTIFYFLGSLGNAINSKTPYKEILCRLVPLTLVALCSLAILGVWVLTRLDAIKQILNSAYPGQRFEQTGSAWVFDPTFGMMLGGPWNGALRSITEVSELGVNQSESSSFLLISFALIPGTFWLLFKQSRISKRTDWLPVALISASLLILAYMYIPGWDSISHLIFFDRVPSVRFRIAFVILGTLFWIVTASLVMRTNRRKDLVIASILSLATWLVLCMIFWMYLFLKESVVLVSTRLAPIIIILTALAILLTFVRRFIAIAAGLLLFSNLMIGVGVNPLYVGIFDLRQTQVGKEVIGINAANPGMWVSVGSASSMAMLMETGVSQLSGVQPFPSSKMWELIDPTGKSEEQWNRLGHIHWHLAEGPLVISNPQPDVIDVRVDPCSQFVQDNIKYFVSDQHLLFNRCLKEISSTTDGNSHYKIFATVPGQ